MGKRDSVPARTGRVKATRTCQRGRVNVAPHESKLSTAFHETPKSLSQTQNEAFHKYTFGSVSGESGGLLTLADERPPFRGHGTPDAYNARVHGTPGCRERTETQNSPCNGKGHHAPRSGRAETWWRKVRDMGTVKNRKDATERGYYARAYKPCYYI